MNKEIECFTSHWPEIFDCFNNIPFIFHTKLMFLYFIICFIIWLFVKMNKEIECSRDMGRRYSIIFMMRNLFIINIYLYFKTRKYFNRITIHSLSLFIQYSSIVNVIEKQNFSCNIVVFRVTWAEDIRLFSQLLKCKASRTRALFMHSYI